LKNNFLSKIFGQKEKALDVSAFRADLVGWTDGNRVNTLDYYYDNQYENGYASIQAITNQFIMIEPFALDANGKPVKNANVMNVLARPNHSMSGLKFREALSIMCLVHNKVYIRVWHNAGKATERNITGLTFMEGVHEYQDEKGTVYQTPQGEILRDDEVIKLMSINPYNLSAGYSPAAAARRWATLSDHVAAYQTGFFENGAVPSGQFSIPASSDAEFKEIVRNLQDKHRGSSRNGNVVYSRASIDPVTGQVGTNSINWIPFNTNNKDLSLQEIFSQANKMMDSVYAVPSSIRGDSTESTYQNSSADQRNFIDYGIRPFATKIWTQFTHELNNITGGLGYLIAVEVKTPHIAEEDKAFAEAQATSTSTLMSLLNAGYTLESAVMALKLDESFLDLDKPQVDTVEDIEEVDEGDEVEDAPDDEKNKALEPITVNCKHCGRYMFKATGTVVAEDVPCPKCKAVSNYKIVSELGNEATHHFTYKETEPKDWKMVAKSKEMSTEQIELIQNKVASIIRKQMEDQINRVDTKTKALGEEDEAKAKLYAEEILVTVQPVIATEGMKQYLLARTIEGISGENLNDFVLDEKQMTKYRKYLHNVLKSYSEDTEKSIKKSLEDSVGNNLPINEVQRNLQGIMQTDEWRVRRLALTETNRAGNAGSIYAMEKVQKDAGIKIEKVWQVRGDACEYCRAMSGTSVGVEDTFVEKGATIDGADGGQLTNNFVSMDVPTAHSNCGCYCIYKVVKD
jgi:phage portal protein BeeE/phage FluMu protein Com